jgi:hypothetical protein|tara:strand:- start:36 stop:533 length:498 start_codon:yes stop_codon:yes gene_type:complete
MAISTIVKTKRDGSLTFTDKDAGSSFTVSYEAGDLSISIPGAGANNYLDRGQITAVPSVRYSDDQPITGSFTAYLRDMSDGSYETLMEIMCQTGHIGSTWVSTLGTTAEVFTVKLTWTVEGTDHGDSADHVCAMDHCYVTGSVSEGDPDTLSINFTSYSVYPTLT